MNKPSSAMRERVHGTTPSIEHIEFYFLDGKGVDITNTVLLYVRELGKPFYFGYQILRIFRNFTRVYPEETFIASLSYTEHGITYLYQGYNSQSKTIFAVPIEDITNEK